MEQGAHLGFWDITASDILTFVMALAVLGLAYFPSERLRGYRIDRGEFSAVVLIAGVLGILVFLKSTDKIGENGLIGLVGSLIGYALGTMRSSGQHRPSNDGD